MPAQQWSTADAQMLNLVAADAAPRIASVLTGIQADDMEKDPHSLKHRAARVYFTGVTGAPGDGDISLSRAFAASFRNTPDTLQNSPENADFTVKSHVKLTPGPAGTTGHPQEHIEIVWQVLDKAGKEAGAATQLHDIEAHSLDQYWGMWPLLLHRKLRRQWTRLLTAIRAGKTHPCQTQRRNPKTLIRRSNLNVDRRIAWSIKIILLLHALVLSGHTGPRLAF